MKSAIKFFIFFAFSCISVFGNEYAKLDCYPEASSLNGASLQDKCVARNCIYQSSSTQGVPWCYFPQDNYGYTMTNSVKVKNGYDITLNRLTSKYQAPFPDPINSAKMEVRYLTNKVLHFKIIDATKSRYEVPIDLDDIEDKSLNEANNEYDFVFENRPVDNVFEFKIKRKSSGLTLFDTSIGGFVFCDQFLQIATRLPFDSNVYGFGENNHPTLSHDFNYKSWGIFARDQSTAWGENTNLYGAQPFYTVLESDGNSHGILFLNSNAMDYAFTPLPSLIMRSIGGIFDFYFFSGPEPEQITQQFTSLVGKPTMIPYFSLGFQLARWGYQDFNDLKRVVEANLKAGIPLDVQYADIEHFKDNMDFTIDTQKFKELPDYFRELQSRGMKTAIILDPALVVSRGTTNYKPYVEGYASDVFIKWPKGISPDYSETNSDIMLGWCWPSDKVAYPDFMTDRTKTWWKKQIVDYRKVNITFDALWIDMNEPVVFNTNEEKPWNWPNGLFPYWTLKCPYSKLDDPPYRTKAVFRHDYNGNLQRISEKTLCMVGLQGDGKYNHYDVHNLYGYSEAKATQDAVREATGKRSFILSRSTFIGSGRYAGHWLGDNEASFTELQRSIIGMIEFNMFGIPYVGADICGFFGQSNEELCTRWLQVGSFYPFSRNHNAENTPDQDPASFSQVLVDSTKKALEVRYTILPYYYTLFYNAHVYGKQVIKALFQEYPKDRSCRYNDRQFLVGNAILVSPVVESGKSSISAYLPPASKWYNYYDGSIASGGFVTLNAPINHINVHIRGGYIIPTQDPANNTYYSRQNPFGLIVALDDAQEASGELFYDDGDSIDSISAKRYFYSKFNYKASQLSMEIVTNNAGPEINSQVLNTVRILGLKKTKVIDVTLISNPNDEKTRVVQIVDINSILLNQHGELQLKNLKIKMNQDFVVKLNLANTTTIVTENVDINDERLRADCYPEPGASESSCKARGCIWSASSTSGVSWCFINKARVGYKVQSNKAQSTEATRNRITSHYDIYKSDSFSLYGNDIKYIKLTVEQKGANALRVTFRDANKTRYEVPVPTTWNNEPSDSSADVNKNDFVVYVENDIYGRFVLDVFRKSTGARLFSTREYSEGFIYSDKFIQLYARLASESVYGWGENTHQRFKHQFTTDSPAFPVWARDQPPDGGNQALYGTQPFYMSVEDDGSAHGLLIMNSNAQEYKLSGLKTLQYRTLGGILDIYMFSGPTPENVIMQFSELVGKPFMPPYYALGFQLCRYGYNNLNNLKAAVQRTQNARIPLDIQYADIDHFDRNLDFTYDKVNFAGLPEYINELNSQGIKFIIIVDPALITTESNYLPYQRGQQQDVWIKWPKNMNPQASESPNNNMLGYVWPSGKVVFPDFFQNKTATWWSNEIKLHYNTLKFQGLWIDMNEPANFGTNQDRPFNLPPNEPNWSLKCPQNEYDDPPYRTQASFGDRLSDKTLCLVGEQTDGKVIYKHYDVHNLYGYTETVATFEALKQTIPTKRPLVISRSTFPSSGKYAGHWLGDNDSNWKQIKYNIIGLLEFNLFGIPYVGADICGFFGTADAELCTRWMQVGAFNPFFRNHNSINNPDQDPGVYDSSTVTAIRKIVEIRYNLLPYLYTLFFDVHVHGGTVVRSLVHEFSKDRNVHNIDEQFLWGSALLISPVIEKGKTSVSAYLPPDARWYDYYTGRQATQSSSFQTLSAPIDYVPLHVRGGYIIPTQDSDLNTDKSRKNPFGLVIGPDANGKATGSLYWDDGDSIDSITANKYNLYYFEYNKSNSTLQSTIVINNFSGSISNVLNTIRIFDVAARPSMIVIDNSRPHAQFTYDAVTRSLEITNLQIPFNKNFSVRLN